MSDSLIQLVFLDSDHARQIGSFNSDLLWELNFNSGSDFANYHVAVKSVIFPNTMYPINESNNKVYFSESGGATLTATLTPNNYSGTEIATELQTQLNAAGANTYTVTFDTQSKKLTIASGVILPDYVVFLSGANSAYNSLGIEVNDGNWITYTGAYPVNLSGTSYVDLQFNMPTQNYTSNFKTNILERIPVAGGFGSIIYWEGSSDDYIVLRDPIISNIELRMLDDNGNLIRLPKNSQVSIVLKLKLVV